MLVWLQIYRKVIVKVVWVDSIVVKICWISGWNLWRSAPERWVYSIDCQLSWFAGFQDAGSLHMICREYSLLQHHGLCGFRMAKVCPGHIVCDPLCGTGSISIQVSNVKTSSLVLSLLSCECLSHSQWDFQLPCQMRHFNPFSSTISHSVLANRLFSFILISVLWQLSFLTL